MPIGRISARRSLADRTTKWVIGLGGAAVIGAITLIFAYLLWVVGPMLWPGSIDSAIEHRVVDRSAALVDISENGEVALRLSQEGIVEFYEVATGRPTAGFDLGRTIAHAQRVYPTVDMYALVDPAGQMSFVKATYTVSFSEGVRTLTPNIEFPFGDSEITLNGARTFDVQLFEDELLIVGAEADTLFTLKYRNVEVGYPLQNPTTLRARTDNNISNVFSGPRNEWVYVADTEGAVGIYGVHGRELVDLGQAQVTEQGRSAILMPLLGRYSLVVASDAGITQWGAFKGADGMALKAMRSFKIDGVVRSFVDEPRRKGFASITQTGALALHYPTSGRTIDQADLNLPPDIPIAISPRSNALVSAPGPDS